MRTFLNALHVLSAVLVVGPLITAPFAGRRAVQRRRPDSVWLAVRQVTLFGAASLITAGLGVLAVIEDDRYDFRDPWIVISSTLYLVALGLVFLYAAPALRRAAKLVEQGMPERAAEEKAQEASPAVPEAGPAAQEAGPAAREAGPAAREAPEAGPAAQEAGPAVPHKGRQPTGGIEQHVEHQLEAITARVALAGLLVLLVFSAVTILMSTRPFR